MLCIFFRYHSNLCDSCSFAKVGWFKFSSVLHFILQSWNVGNAIQGLGASRVTQSSLSDNVAKSRPAIDK